jgi:hypothetical protein
MPAAEDEPSDDRGIDTLGVVGGGMSFERREDRSGALMIG